MSIDSLIDRTAKCVKCGRANGDPVCDCWSDKYWTTLRCDVCKQMRRAKRLKSDPKVGEILMVCPDCKKEGTK